MNEKYYILCFLLVI